MGVLLAEGFSLVYAQTQGDPALQGRLLQSSDGTLFLYWNGAKLGVDILQLPDDVLNAIPDGGTVSRISDLIAAPAPAPEPPPPVVAPPPAPPPQPSGPQVLYQADWSGGMAGWTGTPNWKTTGGLLVSDGSWQGTVLAPFKAPSADYAVEASMRLPSKPSSSRFGFGVVARRTEDTTSNAYIGGSTQCDLILPCTVQHAVIVITQTNDGKIASNPFNPSTDWHTYRLEARANNLRLLIDGSMALEATDNRLLDGRDVGLYSAHGTQVNVRDFKVMSF